MMFVSIEASDVLRKDFEFAVYKQHDCYRIDFYGTCIDFLLGLTREEALALYVQFSQVLKDHEGI